MRKMNALRSILSLILVLPIIAQAQTISIVPQPVAIKQEAGFFFYR